MANSKLIQKPGINFSLPPIKVMIALLAVYLIWGSTYLGGAIALRSYPPFMLVAIRLIFAIIILMTGLTLTRAHFPTKRQMLNASFVGGLMFGGGAGLVSMAQGLGVASGLASLAVGAVPIWATIFASILGYRPTQLEMIGLVIGISGVALLNMENGLQSQPLGAFILLIGPMMWAFGSMISNRLSMPKGFMGTAFQMIGGFIVLMLISFIRGEQFPTQLELVPTVAVIYLALFGTLVAFSSYMYLVRTVRPALATSYAYVNPVIAVVLGITLNSEPITSLGILAMVVIVTGVVLVMMGKQKSKDQ
jgi:drug/metabolite transporter (DMT)-like permease